VNGVSGLTYTSGGALTCSGDVVAYSDSRVKTDLKKIGGALEKLSKINGYTFNRTDNVLDTKRHAGVIAQEVIEVLPEVVYEQDNKLSVAYGNLAALLIEATKELEVRVSLLEKK
jgi:lambda repressor-like predicted transcriptional regulator